jgi:hypothetical protein
MLRSRQALSIAALALLLCSPPVHAAGDGKASCEITENGKQASGTIVVLDGKTELARGSCGKPIAVQPGEHTAVLTLDGALDSPEQQKPLSVQADKTSKLSADFATGLLEVRITSQGRDTAGMAVIRKDGRQIGTLGSGVSAHLSAGAYEVVARYRTQEKRFEKVAIQAGQRSVLDAAFE